MTGRLGRLVAVGRTAEVYVFDGGVVKLHFPTFEANARLEAEVGATLVSTGLAAPRLLGTETIDGRVGLVYERADGPSMLAALVSRPWAVRSLARTFAELHAGQHDTPADALPSLRSVLRHTVITAEMPERVREAALHRLDGLPDGDSLCHGDMHPGNVILTRAGAMVIDWVTATRGPAAADIARTEYLLRHAAAERMRTTRGALVAVLRRRFTRDYRSRYRQLRPIPEAELAEWRLPILAARLGEGVAADDPTLATLLARELRR